MADVQKHVQVIIDRALSEKISELVLENSELRKQVTSMEEQFTKVFKKSMDKTSIIIDMSYAMDGFCYRVERGEVHSQKTYAKFREILLKHADEYTLPDRLYRSIMARAEHEHGPITKMHENPGNM